MNILVKVMTNWLIISKTTNIIIMISRIIIKNQSIRNIMITIMKNKNNSICTIIDTEFIWLII